METVPPIILPYYFYGHFGFVCVADPFAVPEVIHELSVTVT